MARILSQTPSLETVCHVRTITSQSTNGLLLTAAALGRANERLARVQETYAQGATSSWLEGLDRGLIQMKEYQVCHSMDCQRSWLLIHCRMPARSSKHAD